MWKLEGFGGFKSIVAEYKTMVEVEYFGMAQLPVLTLNRAPTSDRGASVSFECPSTSVTSQSIKGSTRRQVYVL